jgi:pyridoxal phosphate enzyme (YggS family)
MSDVAVSEIRNRLGAVRAKIESACKASGRAPSSVKLIAVSKTKSVELIRSAMAAGQLSFGENYVNELLGKMTAEPEADWHFIGSLQTNKAKQIAGHVNLIHSVDRTKLAEEISKSLEKTPLVVQKVLLQVRVGDEVTKHGVELSSAASLLETLLPIKNINVSGLMCLPPLTDDENRSRKWFAEIRECFENLRNGLSATQKEAFVELSMGTSADFEFAIQEGATIVRVGTAIFGSRN